LPIKAFDLNRLYDRQLDFKKILARVASPSVCQNCGNTHLRVAFGKKKNVMHGNYTFTFDNILYLICDKCKEKYISDQDSKAMDVIMNTIDSMDEHLNTNNFTVLLPYDKLGEEFLSKHTPYIKACVNNSVIDLRDITFVVEEEHDIYPEDMGDGEDIVYDD